MDAFSLYESAVREGRLAVRAVLLDGPHAGAALCLLGSGARAGSLGSTALDAAAQPLLTDALHTQQSARVPLPGAGGDLFLDVHAPPPRLVIVGAVHTAIPLVTFANVLGFETIVVDSRSAFATPDRFGHAAQLIVRWPADLLDALALDEGCYVVVLTHDAKIDDPALARAAQSPARYVGALGSRRTHATRLQSLREAGVPQEALARIHAPIGLDLGGRTPEEIALAIMAQVVAVRNGRAA